MLVKKILILSIVTLIFSSNSMAFYQIETEYDNDFPICRTMEKVMLEPIPSNNSKPMAIDTPSQFSWTNYNGDWTTPARFQGNCGSCWAFATVAVIESVINIKENNPRLDPDLSEQYILSCLGSAGSCSGGSFKRALENIMDADSEGNFCNGLPLESCMPYQADDNIDCSDKSSDWQDKLVPLLDYDSFYAGSGDKQIIKSTIFEKGPVITSMYASDDFTTWGMLNHHSDQFYPYTVPSPWQNHVVIIVGWKDDSSIGNGGYWICKNSWGPFWANNGFFNIEYRALNIDSGTIAWVDYNPESFDWDPVASTNGMYHGSVGNPVTFFGMDSFDVEGEIIDYSWDFGDGETGEGLTVAHEYGSKGIFNVTLTVKDQIGKKSSVNTAAFIDVWSIGNEWKYLFNTLEFSFIDDQTKISLEANIPQINFKINEETLETYVMKFSGTLDADISLEYGIFNILAQLTKTSISGEIIFSKRNQSINQIDCNINGKLIFPKFLPIPFSYKTDISIEFNPDLKYVNYPLYDKKEYDNPSTRLTVNGDISSPLLNIINFANKIASFFKIEFIPEEFARFLPVIRFEEIFEEFLGKNDIIIPTIPDLSISKVKTTVPSGTYNAFEINSKWGGSFHYSHDVENIIKIDIAPSSVSTGFGKINFAVHGEMIDTNYE
ncbi:MAG: PKD domain-containing protein [Candidatus Thermoplasmatota archaeon]|nr:PKD domain-containing protein [Candidatus Thermoplasmatota archaeon]